MVPDYQQLTKNLKSLPDNLTLAEKILYTHLASGQSANNVQRGETYLKLNPDRVAMQDASAQMALLQFMLSGMKTTAVPTTVHCDHLIEAHLGADKDVETSKVTNAEIFNFLESCSKKYGIGFWKPGSGIIHQIVLENYAAPGGLMLGTDSHTPNAGGLGMIAIGVGGADAVDAMAAIPWELKAPKILGVHLTGKLNGWTSPKDVILHLAGKLTVSGGTGHIVEYFGPGTESLSCTGMATICNMGAEIGATTSLFPYSHAMQRYLIATNRQHIANAADQAKEVGLLSASKSAQYDKVIEINLSTLEPHINGPFTPDASTPISQMKALLEKNGWKDNVSACLIGSCTNSSYQDMERASSVAKQAQEAGIRAKTEFLITPGSEVIRATVERDGQSGILEEAGGKVLANACGPCIGQWKRTDITKDEENAILTSFNRNFKARNDGFSKTMNFLASPEIVTAIAFSGKLSFNPITDTVLDKNGKPFKFSPPEGRDLPTDGFETGRATYAPPPASPLAEPNTSIKVDPKSKRLELLQPFSKWDGKEFTNLRVLVRVRGKCTTDHISAAGKWLAYKGHLSNISTNTLIGATNDYNGLVNVVSDNVGGSGSIPDVAAQWKEKGWEWCVVTDWNYGEGSAREHAAMQPRFLGGRMLIARSFARIHETNLKKQGVLPVWFENPDDYARIPEGALISTHGLTKLAPGSKIVLVVEKDGKKEQIPCKHTMSEDQIAWFKAGSALNAIRDAQL